MPTILSTIGDYESDKNFVGHKKEVIVMRLKEHLGYVRNSKLNEPTGLHFNLPGHNIYMLKASILKKCFHSSTTYRKQREEFLFQAFQTKFKCMNKML